MDRIAKFLLENYDKLGTYANLNDDDVSKSMSKIIARHLIAKTELSIPSIARRIAAAFIKYSKTDSNDLKLATCLRLALLAADAEIADPEYKNHAGVASAHIY